MQNIWVKVNPGIVINVTAFQKYCWHKNCWQVILPRNFHKKMGAFLS